jgi:hypothetical protein
MSFCGLDGVVQESGERRAGVFVVMWLACLAPLPIDG